MIVREKSCLVALRFGDEGFFSIIIHMMSPEGLLLTSCGRLMLSYATEGDIGGTGRLFLVFVDWRFILS